MGGGYYFVSKDLGSLNLRAVPRIIGNVATDDPFKLLLLHMWKRILRRIVK
jgi:hypothetical protein